MSVQELVDAGFHFGHRTSRWNPKMKPFIFGKRNLIHIINLRETLKGLITACKFLTNLVQNQKGRPICRHKWQARDITVQEAKRCGMHYVSERWLGGTLTNFDTIRKQLLRLVELENLEKTGGSTSLARRRSLHLIVSVKAGYQPGRHTAHDFTAGGAGSGRPKA